MQVIIADEDGVIPFLTMPNRTDVFVEIEGTVIDDQKVFKIQDVQWMIEMVASAMLEGGDTEMVFPIYELVCSLKSSLIETESGGIKGFLFEAVISTEGQPIAERQMLLTAPLLPEEREALHNHMERSEKISDDTKWN